MANPPSFSRAILAATFLLAGACSSGTPTNTGGSPAPEGSSDGQAVTIRGLMFLPGRMEVATGTTVRWTNEDPAAHTVTSGRKGTQGIPGVTIGTRDRADGLFDQKLDPGAEFSFTFDDAGTFTYFCRIHAGMTATVVVR